MTSAGEQVGRELDPLELQVQRPGDGPHRERLRQPRHALEQHVAVGQQADEKPVEQPPLPDQHALDREVKRVQPLPLLLDVLRGRDPVTAHAAPDEVIDTCSLGEPRDFREGGRVPPLEPLTSRLRIPDHSRCVALPADEKLAVAREGQFVDGIVVGAQGQERFRRRDIQDANDAAGLKDRETAAFGRKPEPISMAATSAGMVDTSPPEAMSQTGSDPSP